MWEEKKISVRQRLADIWMCARLVAARPCIDVLTATLTSMCFLTVTQNNVFSAAEKRRVHGWQMSCQHPRKHMTTCQSAESYILTSSPLLATFAIALTLASRTPPSASVRVFFKVTKTTMLPRCAHPSDAIAFLRIFCVCVYVCMYVCMYVCVHLNVCMYACGSMYVCIWMYVFDEKACEYLW